MKEEPGQEAAFLMQQKGVKAATAADARIVEANAEWVVFEHPPCPKFRIAIPLLRPWRASDYETQVVANAAWRERVETLAAALSLDHDQTCTDTSRLFYLPRMPAGGATPETLSLDGKPCDLFRLPKIRETMSAGQPRDSSASSVGFGFVTDTYVVLQQADAGTLDDRANNTCTSDVPGAALTMTDGQVNRLVYGNVAGVTAHNWLEPMNNPTLNDPSCVYSEP